MNIFTFDIETIPDVKIGKALYNLTETNPEEIANIMFAKRREETDGSDFLPLYLHQVAAISVVLKTTQNIKIWSLGQNSSSEQEIIQRFFTGIEKYSPILVSWNGSGFDLPVLHYRSLLHGIAAPRYWETGDEDSSFRWNNYLNRYHHRHTDIMDILAGYQARANAPLDTIATMLGLPGKMGMSGKQVWEQYLANDIDGIRNYCETDVLNTYLIYQRFRLIQGKLTENEYSKTKQEVIETLLSSDKQHLQNFAKHMG